MKRGPHSVYYDTSAEPHLPYAGPDDMVGYAAACQSVEHLPQGDLVLLKQLREFVRFVEDLIVAVNAWLDARDQRQAGHSALALAILQEEQRRLSGGGGGDDDAPPVSVVDMLGVAWFWHKVVRQRNQPVTGLYANALLLSWTAYCKLFHLYVVSDTERYEQLRTMTADQFAYCGLVSEHCNVVVSHALVLHYRVSELWAAVRRIVPSLYLCCFHPEMKRYVHALFFRYCDLFCAQQDQLDYVLDNPLFYARCTVAEERAARADVPDTEQYDAYRSISVRLSAQHVLKSEYFYEGELLFFFQLGRLRLSELLHEQYADDPIILTQRADHEQMKRSNTTLLRMLSELVVHPYLKTYVVEPFRRTIMSLYMYHGERERYVRRNPTAACEVNDILATCRPNDHMQAVVMQKATLGDIIAKLCEREIILIAKYVTHRWIEHEEVREHAAIDAAFVIEELASLVELEALVTRNEEHKTEVPVLLKLVHTYYVMYRGAVYKSVRFIDAYLVWLSLLVNKAQLLGTSHLPELIRPELQYFVPL